MTKKLTTVQKKFLELLPTNPANALTTTELAAMKYETDEPSRIQKSVAGKAILALYKARLIKVLAPMRGEYHSRYWRKP